MGPPSAGDVVLVRFPFSDLSNSKLRPAVVLANADRNDWILCQITSNAFADDVAIAIDNVDLRSGGLKRISYARTGKLFTANQEIILRTAGTLSTGKFNEIVAGVVSRFKTLNRE
ncbi:MAG: type II toxin-antitoxin system PemK/MazF family toxin [Acidobacteriota bacterium]|nr:MAG: type II toxin-antitoxin system PemK/MazF family toxin [Acidobacteriota bacterium]